MKKTAITTCSLLLIAAMAGAQSIWDGARLAEVKAKIGQPAYAAACRRLLTKAEAQLTMQPPSVMMKPKVAVSGDKHDYMSLSRYFWPDPTKPDGLPYVSRDGVSNPELELLDRNRLSEMASGVTTLSLAWFFSGDERYARKATELVRTWFLDPATRMNPNLDYAQVVPGLYDGRGRCYGVIDAYSFVEMLDAVQLLEQSEAFTKKDAAGLRRWFARLLDWILTSPQGIEEGGQKNNHSTAHDVQVIAYALYVGNRKVMTDYLSHFHERRMLTQIEPDGRQPHELRRTLAFGYSQYNLSHIIDVFFMARHAGIGIEGQALMEKAADFLVPYVGKDVAAWPYEQISEWDLKQNELCKDLYRLALLNPARTDLRQLARRHLVKRWDDPFFLLYYEPDETDHAFAQADTQLRLLLKQTRAGRARTKDRQLLMPRSVERDGGLRLVAIRDWCSGFFPGELWLMYEYSHDRYWREQAVSETWLVEANKLHDGTHDLGFMLGSSFGQAWRLTGEQSYRDVLLQAARTLATRFNPTVGCIRSWSWGTPERWQYAVIIDNMLNLELLFEASRLTGDRTYYNMAVSHANTTLKNHFRQDGSSYHVVDYNPADGTVIKRITHQGLSDESVWSRGQAWGLYGFTMCYRYTHDVAYLNQARRIADFFFSQKDLPDDLIPYWDMRDPAIHTGSGPALDGGCPRDASAAAVFASGLYELATFVEGADASRYRELADRIVDSLEHHYQAEPLTAQGFLLLHSTGNYPANDEIDVPISYADYYYLEALHRRAAKIED